MYFSNVINFISSKHQIFYSYVYYLNHQWFNYLIIFFLVIIFFKNIKVLYSIVFSFFFFCTSFKKITVYKIPAALALGYNNVHPPLLYLGLVLFFICNFLFETGVVCKKITHIGLVVFTLLLGSLWGLGNSV